MRPIGIVGRIQKDTVDMLQPPWPSHRRDARIDVLCRCADAFSKDPRDPGVVDLVASPCSFQANAAPARQRAVDSGRRCTGGMGHIVDRSAEHRLA